MASDFHSHVCKSGAVTLLSVPYPEPGGGWPWSLEFHPWHLPETVEDGLPGGFAELLESAAALGEVGLDRLRGPVCEVQRRWLKLLLEAARALKKPVVFHCVRMVPELLAETKPYGGLKRLFHGFRGSPELLEELRSHGFYVSLAPAALERSELMEHLRSAGLGGIGFETDTLPEPVERILERAARRLNFSYAELERITDQTFQEFLHHE
ncbi:TatD family hydrolase [Victivallis vadensis]|uniref:TatD family hydrolase n=1 Tax=Victivallis vadensis TaxID=172901 RepID=UPI002671B4F1|nr:TatD family hydrolase [Victivallis vadensis]